MISLTRYTPSLRATWDDIVAGARNGSFLHLRGFMDYHSDRFDDHSLVAQRDGQPLCVLPANVTDDTLWSHQGLTYGGWVMPTRHVDPAVMLEVAQLMVGYARAQGLRRIVYKPIPHIYHRYPAEDDLYGLWRMGARPVEVNISSTIDLTNAVAPDRGCRSAANAARRAGVNVGRSDAWTDYWQILTDVLKARHDTCPVHTADEMRLLVSRFPDRIRLYAAYDGDLMVAGVVMFEVGPVAHCQYIAASERGRELKALTLLFDHLINLYAERQMRYFDFGISNERSGTLLNRGLIEQKCRLGGRGIVYQRLEIDL